MGTYLEYLKGISSDKTFARKLDYIRYNFKKYLRFQASSDVRLLEIGPGLGEAVSYFNSLGHTHIDVIDNDDSILEYIAEKYKIHKTFKATELDKIDTSLDQYDAIVCTQVLEHVPIDQYKPFLSTLFGHLKKDGHMIITVPNMANPFTLFERYGDITHTNGFTDNSLKELISLCNIPASTVIVNGFKIPPYSLLQLVRIGFQKMLHFILLLMSIANGGGYTKLLTPNITLVVKK